ncbi:GntR family transcriptional regulator [Lacticaseibacillus rhamnosus]|uniref:GntR family transcriptional regulator n=1 Tax=Lacticaseibacillus rhamnosus TaxID=47715 RepID=UPI0022E6E5A5|nr:GntR family transcriptional regulator [Lacticaseibacillus rhamnosus]
MAENVSSEPLYRQVYSHILEDLINGKYKEGDLLPSETQLQSIYSTSRITIRQAVSLLQDQGYVQKASGIGTIVISTKRALQLNRIISFKEENKDNKIGSKQIAFSIHKPSPIIADRLRVAKGTKVYDHERIRTINKEPIGIQRVYVSTDLVDLDEELISKPDFSLYETFQNQGIFISNAVEEIEARNADERIASLLNLKNSAAVLFLSRTTFDQNQRPVEVAQIIYRADRYRYTINLTNNDGTDYTV